MEVVIFVVHVARLPSHHYDNVLWQLISMYNIQAARRKNKLLEESRVSLLLRKRR